MRIVSLHIDGFGALRNTSLGDFPTGLVLLVGDNEAGKTTCLAFIRDVLFGFRDGRYRENTYLQPDSSLQGGQLTIVSDRLGETVVERRPGKKGGNLSVLFDDGRKGGEEALQEVLGATTRDLFKNVYAFSLAELQTMETLDNEAVKNMLYGAAMGAATLALPTALSRIDAVMGELFKPGGRNPKINQKLTALETLKARLREARKDIDRYDEASLELLGVEKRIGEVRAALARDRIAKDRTATRIALWDDWITLGQLDRSLAELPVHVATFPEDGMGRLERLSEKCDRDRQILSDLRAERDDDLRNMEGLAVDENMLHHSGSIQELVSRKEVHLNDRSNLSALHQRLGLIESDIDRVIGDLGNDWTEERALAVDRSLFTREAVLRFRERFETSAAEMRSHATLVDIKKGELEAALDAEAETRKALESFGNDDAGKSPPGKRHALIRTLRSLVIQKDRLETQMVGDRSRSFDLRQQRQEYERQLSDASGIDLKPVFLTLSLAGALFFLTLIFLKGRDLLFLAGPVLFLAGLVLYWLNDRLLKKARRRAAGLEEQTKVIDARVLEIETALGTTNDALVDLRERIRESAALLSAKSDVTLAELDLMEALADEESDRIEERRTLEKVFEERKNRVQAVKRELDKVTTVLEQILKDETEARESWSVWLAGSGLNRDILPATALDALAKIGDCVRSIREKETLEKESLRLSNGIDDYQALAASVCAAIGEVMADPEGLAALVDRLGKEYESAKNSFARRQDLARRVGGTNRKIEDAEAVLVEDAEAMRLLLEMGCAASEDEFRLRGRLNEENKRLLSAASVARGNLRKISGEGNIDVLTKELSDLSLEQLRIVEAESTDRLEGLEHEQEGLLRLRADTAQRIAGLASADDVSRLRTEEEVLLEEIRTLAREWGSQALAKGLLLEARKRFEEERQPKVISDAARFFREITGGKYVKVVAPIGGETIEIVTHRGEVKRPEILSRGTAEQLFLALRFGYISNHYAAGETLPVIMDDVLVNFDPKRAELTSRAILTLAESRQILYFTCHPETVAVFKVCCATAPVFAL
jgi:uncharacterized protein YhaN